MSLVDSYNKYIASQMLKQQQGGSVNLFNRPQIDASVLNERGWDAGDGVATVYSSTYGNGPYGNFTPIVASNGQFKRALTLPELDSYAGKVMNGAPDSLGLQIGPKVSTLEEALENAEAVHRLQEAYYNRLMRDMYAQ